MVSTFIDFSASGYLRLDIIRYLEAVAKTKIAKDSAPGKSEVSSASRRTEQGVNHQDKIE